MSELAEREASLLAAHEAGDLPVLIRLYAERARELEADDIDAACFYMVNAYVFALELGLPEHEEYFEFLLQHKREEAHAQV